MNQFYSFACGYAVFQHHLLKRLFFLCGIFLITSVENHLPIYVRVYFWTFYSVPLVSVSVFMPVTHCSDYCSFVIMKSGTVSHPMLIFFYIDLVIWSLLRFYMNFKMNISIFTTDVIEILNL